jgi:organic hydroperoxide reductase OsmC/OhrA
MSEYHAEIVWERGAQDFLSGRYSRQHVMRFDGGTDVPASASPHVVPVPFSDPAAVDPEEAFVAALASCHMLFFLGIAAHRKFQVDRYRDAAVGTLAKNAEGLMAMTDVVLRPVVEFSGARMPTQEELESIHHRAHEQCYIANSVKSAVRVEVQRL